MSPKYLYAFWSKIEDGLKKTSKIFLMLDYDGTITPIAKKPDLALLDSKTKEILKKIISKKERFRVAIVSGRSIKRLKQLIGLRGLYYVGVHGLEIKGPNLSFIHKDATKTKPLLVEVYKDLVKKLSKVEGVLVENKGLTIAIHYRLASKESIPFIARKVLEAKSNAGLKLLKGKKVFELAPPINWGKGNATLILLERFGFKFTPVYFGDNKTDEDAFKALKNMGLTVVVGKKRSSTAEYYVKNIDEVLRFLQKLLFSNAFRKPF